MHASSIERGVMYQIGNFIVQVVTRINRWIIKLIIIKVILILLVAARAQGICKFVIKKGFSDLTGSEGAGRIIAYLRCNIKYAAVAYPISKIWSEPLVVYHELRSCGI